MKTSRLAPSLPRLLWPAIAWAIGIFGIAARARELGTWGLSSDEAWVALSTRVEGLDQFWLAIAMTPVAWAGLLKGVATVFGGGEAALRAVPFLFGCATMWLAYRAGRRFAEHPLGGVLALAVVAFDPLSITYAKVLKQYTAEAFSCLLGFAAAARFVDRGGTRDLVLLACALTLGLGFANSQLFLGPPILAALLLDAILRRDRRAAREVLVTALVVGVCAGLFYGFLLRPRLPAARDRYWSSQVYLPLSWQAAPLLWTRLAWSLGPALGRLGMVCAGPGLAVAAISRRQRVIVVALALLLLEAAVLSLLGILAVSQPRILLFLTTALGVYGAAALAFVVLRARRRPILGALATAALAVVVLDAVRSHDARTLGAATPVEDAGRLVQRLEAERGPGETVLVHQKALFIFAYYRQATPVLRPWPKLSVGYLPEIEDPRIVVVDGDRVARKAREALESSERVWLLASRVRSGEERRIRARLAKLASTERLLRRRSAFLLALRRREPGDATGRGPSPAPRGPAPRPR